MSKLKVVFVGSDGVGKTTLINRAVGIKDEDRSGDAVNGKVNFEKKDYELKIIDTHGWEPGKMRSVDVFVVCFAHDDEDSYLEVSSWVKKVKQESPEATLIVVGTKNDLEYDEEIIRGDNVKEHVGAKLYLSVNQNEITNFLEEIVRAKEDDFDEELVTPGTEKIKDNLPETSNEEEKEAKKPYSDKKRRLGGFKKTRDNTPVRDFKKMQGVAIDFMSLIGNENFSDCELSMVDFNGETYTVPCHRLILSARSAAFKTMFFGQDVYQKRIVLENVTDRRVLDAFIKFLYTDTLDVDDDLTYSLIKLADQFAIGSLKIACGVYAKDKITEENWLEVYKFAKQFHETTLANQALEVPAALMPEIFENKLYMNYDFEVMDQLLSRDDLCLDEKSLFDLVCTWGADREEEGKKLLKKVRLPLIGAKALVEEIKGHKWITHEEYLEAIEYFACPRIFKDKIKQDPRYRSRRGMCQFGWDLTNGITNVEVSNFDKTIKKIGTNNWDAMILSDVALESGLQYWQIKIDVLNPDKSGMALGLTNDRGIGHSNYSSCCSVNMSSGAYLCNAVDVNVYPTYNVGDVIGFVVDFQLDEIKIYQNGKLTHKGTQRPSQLNQIWAAVFLYYNGDQITLVDDIPMGDLIDE